MPEFGPAPSDESIERERERWIETRDTRQRVKDVIVGVREPTPIAALAERAACSPNAARKHLSELADLGVARRWTDGDRARYARNDEYFRWRRANELATERTSEELLDRLRTLKSEDEAFQERYGVPTPDAVSFPPDADHETVHELWETTGEWASIRRDLGVYRDAISMARRKRDGLHA
ncbi:DUF7342 family protein [Halegenticoccus tardaugens]|uniref:DUF7342 family protein n=1 Tax=Halegenticoccus tardaugens TaxID=2071624 RepID=UPI00100A3682|nr:transcriptional regulator [Halegenticoccus tardaugens]